MDFLRAHTSFGSLTEVDKNSKTTILEINKSCELSSLTEDHIEPDLTNREQEVLYLLSEGFRTNVIAKMLFISPQTVSTHRKHMIKKLGAKTTPHLVGIAIRAGLI